MRLDGRIDPARIGGPGAAVGDTLVWDGMRWLPGAGSSWLGRALVQFTFPTITSNSTDVQSTGSVVYPTGDVGITADGSGSITVCTDSVDSVYITEALFYPGPASSVTLTHVHQAVVYDPTMQAAWRATFLNQDDNRGIPGTSTIPLAGPSTDTAYAAIASTGGTGLTFTGAVLLLYVERFAA